MKNRIFDPKGELVPDGIWFSTGGLGVKKTQLAAEQIALILRRIEPGISRVARREHTR